VRIRLEHIDAPAAHDELRRGLGLRLQEHRVHVDDRSRAASEGLQRCRAADLAAIPRDRGVVRHVLRLEGPHDDAAIRERSAQAGDEQ
jgi:hypothetical protein